MINEEARRRKEIHVLSGGIPPVETTQETGIKGSGT
jgi:hypothetical protein